MKRKIIFTLSLICIATVLFILVSCGATHEHNYGATWRQNDNYHWHACLVEGCEATSEKAVHTFVKDGVSKDATCDVAGYRKEKCSVCGLKREVPLEALGHKLSEDVVSPSCAGDGYTLITCTRKGCGFSEKKNIVPGGHDFGEVIINPTCTEGGKTILTCLVCEYVEEANPVEPLGHDAVEFVVEPTCIAEGYTTVTCLRCDYSDRINPTEKIAHNYVEDVVEPTCTEGGYTAKICSECKDAQDKTNFTDPLGHDEKKGTPVLPTCEEEGYTPVTCSRCDYTNKTDIVDALGHDTVKGTPVEVTCIFNGYTPVTCTRCDYVGEVDIVEAIGHSYYNGEDEKEGEHYRIFDEDLPTCDTEGKKYYICLNCRQMPIEEGKNPVAIPALGHDMQKTETVPPTCTLNGFDIMVCTRCEKEEYKDSADAIGHKYYMEADAKENEHYLVTLEPTCTETGEKSYYCINEGCGELAANENGKSEIPKLDHNFVKTVDPWCGNDSHTEYECDRVCRGVECNETKREKSSEEKLHTYNLEKKTVEETCVDYAKYECLVCQRVFTAYEGDEYGQPTGEHRYDAFIETINPTCTEKGYDIYGCTAGNCNTTEKKNYTDIIPHTLGEASALGTVSCYVCNKSYVDITAEAVSDSEAICICGKDPCECGGTTADLEGFSKPKDPMPITKDQEFTITEVIWTDGAHPLAIGNGLIVINSTEEAVLTVTIYEKDGAEALYTFERTGSSIMIDLYQYATVGKVVIKSNADATVAFFKTI